MRPLSNILNTIKRLFQGHKHNDISQKEQEFSECIRRTRIGKFIEKEGIPDIVLYRYLKSDDFQKRYNPILLNLEDAFPFSDLEDYSNKIEKLEAFRRKLNMSSSHFDTYVKNIEHPEYRALEIACNIYSSAIKDFLRHNDISLTTLTFYIISLRINESLLGSKSGGTITTGRGGRMGGSGNVPPVTVR